MIIKKVWQPLEVPLVDQLQYVLEKLFVMLVLDKDTFTVCAKLAVSPKGANISRLMSNVIPYAITLLLEK